jgi:Protein of unknown function (DUF3500)
MMDPKDRRVCPECDDVSRRAFLKTVGGAALALSAGSLPLLAPRPARASVTSKPETLVKTLHDSLTETQRKSVLFPWDHPLRRKVDNNWAITKPTISEFFTSDQQAMIREIFRELHSAEYLPKVMAHMDEDAGGIGNYHIALFGTPGSGKFEWVLTGRHCTVRCDGDSTEGAAFGGPIFYGHAAHSFNEAADHPDNVYWYQAKRANEVFKALDGKQREVALVRTAVPAEQGTETVRLHGTSGTLPGMPVADMTRDQKALVRQVMADLLLPFRRADADEAMKRIHDAGGLEKLHMAFYQQEDIGNDGVWDIWRLEGPAMVWYFRGAPHVHTWVHVRSAPESA